MEMLLHLDNKTSHRTINILIFKVIFFIEKKIFFILKLITGDMATIVAMATTRRLVAKQGQGDALGAELSRLGS